VQNKIKSNVFGRGFENGEKTSIGCSYKGRLWSYRIAYDVSEWVQWCQAIGAKLRDETISVEKILEQVMIPVQITERPDLVPLAIEWSEDPLQRSVESLRLCPLNDQMRWACMPADLSLAIDGRLSGP
jgi:hypothetical protein